MHGKGEDIGLTCQDGCGAIPLVHVTVHNEHLLGKTFLQQMKGGDGEVVEDAKALCPIGKGMVRSAGNVHGDASALQGPLGTFKGALHDDPFSLDHGMRPWESASSFLLSCPLAVLGPTPIVFLVGQQQGAL